MFLFSVLGKKREEPPEVEWWDKFLLTPIIIGGKDEDNPEKKEITLKINAKKLEKKLKKKYTYPESISSTGKELQLEEVSYFVEHPVPVFPPGEDMTDKPMKLFLTKREQKKLTKRNRAEKLKENRERVLLGLEPPPKPKVKISNLMRVLGSEATIDPTQVEKEVKKQMAEREQDHDSRNQARKLTKDQKYEKK